MRSEYQTDGVEFSRCVIASGDNVSITEFSRCVIASGDNVL